MNRLQGLLVQAQGYLKSKLANNAVSGPARAIADLVRAERQGSCGGLQHLTVPGSGQSWHALPGRADLQLLAAAALGGQT